MRRFVMKVLMTIHQSKLLQSVRKFMIERINVNGGFFWIRPTNPLLYNKHIKTSLMKLALRIIGRH